MFLYQESGLSTSDLISRSLLEALFEAGAQSSKKSPGGVYTKL